MGEKVTKSDFLQVFVRPTPRDMCLAHVHVTSRHQAATGMRFGTSLWGAMRLLLCARRFSALLFCFLVFFAC